MCGYSGLAFASESALARYGISHGGFAEAAGRVRHRGGDGEGQERFTHAWLSHHRLAFQDVAQGAQPFLSTDGDAAIVFNGEVYNHLGLRGAISRSRGTAFRTHSDTETLLEGFLAFGPAFQNELDGEYSYVVTRGQGRSLDAARDPFGVKPLFFWFADVDTSAFAVARPEYAFRTSALAFASEMKALPVEKRWSRDGALRQFTGLYEPLRTPFDGIVALPAGARLEARLDGDAYQVTLRLRTEPVRRSPRGMHYFHPSDLAGEFSSRMALSVADRLLSDVELGVYLSGGVDSKTVGHELSHHLRAMARPPLKSFTVGFAAGDFDETREALSYAAAQGFQPHVLEVAGEDLAYSYPIAVAHSENLQPYTNGAAKWWLSRFARRHVHGVLTGDGADELLCGYPSFRYAAWWKFALRGRGGVATPNPSGDSGTPARVLRILERLPLGTHWRDAVYFRRFVADALDPWLAGASSAGLGDDFVDSLALWGVAHPLFGQIRAIARGLFPSTEEADAWLTAQGPSVRSWFSLGFEGNLDPADPANALLCWQSYFCRTHLPVQVLNWVGDRMEMANTLEGRTPFLSRRLAQFVQGLGDASLVSGFQDKAILRQAYIPKLGAFARTPKRQFGAPFLDNEALLKRFPAESAFSAIGMDGEAVLAKLKGESGQKIATTAVDGPNGTSFQGKHTLGSKEEARAAQAAYDRTHLASALQTAVSFGIVHRTLVEGKAPVRDSGFEEKVLAKERISG